MRPLLINFLSVRPQNQIFMMQPASQLPVELILIVTANIQETKDLKSCTLVSRKWFNVSRQHLFRNLKNKSRNEEDLQHLATFLRDSHFVCEYVRELRLVSRALLGSDSTLDAYILYPIIQLLPNLTALQLEDYRFVGQPRPLHIPPVPINLTKLSLYISESFFKPRGVLDFLRLFSSVGELSIRFVTYSPGNLDYQLLAEDLELYPVSHLAINFIYLAYRGIQGTSYMTELLQKTRTLDTLRSVRYYCDDDAKAIVLGHLLRSVGETLLHCDIDISSYVMSLSRNGTFDVFLGEICIQLVSDFRSVGDTEHAWGAFSLPHCTSLQSLTLRGLWTESLSANQCLWNSFLAILFLTTRSVRSLTFVLHAVPTLRDVAVHLS